MAEAQCTENEANPEQVQGAPNPAMNPTVDPHKTKEEAIKEFVWQQGTIALDWYVPDFHNTRADDLIEERLPIETREGRKTVPASKMPDLGWDIAETQLQKIGKA